MRLDAGHGRAPDLAGSPDVAGSRAWPNTKPGWTAGCGGRGGEKLVNELFPYSLGANPALKYWGNISSNGTCPPRVSAGVCLGRQTEGGGSMAGNGGRGRGKGFVRLTRAGRRSTPRSNTRRPSWRNTPFPGSSVTVPLNIRRHPPSACRCDHLPPSAPFPLLHCVCHAPSAGILHLSRGR